jgi:hypothetical protein
MTAQPADLWRGTINQILYGAAPGRLDDETAERTAQAMVDYRVFVDGPAAYLSAIEQALRSGGTLAGGLPVNLSETEFRDFLSRIRARLIAAQPWPQPRFRKLPVSQWQGFGEARPIARIDKSVQSVADRLPSIFDHVAIGDARLPVLILRLRTGEDVALMGSVDSTARVVTLLQREERDPRETIEHFTEFTGLPAEPLSA